MDPPPADLDPHPSEEDHLSDESFQEEEPLIEED